MKKEQKSLVVYCSYIIDKLNEDTVKKENNKFIGKYISDYMKVELF